MKIIRVLAFLLSPFFLVGFVSAQTASSPLTLPATDRVVVGTCYVKWLSKTSFQRLDKGGFSQYVQEETDKLISEFSKGMGEEGFKVVLLEKCSNDDDTVGGGITAMFAFGMTPQFFGEDLIRLDAFLKVPAEKRLIPVKEQISGADGPKKIVGIQGVASSLSKAMAKAIREAQPKVQPKAPPEDKAN